ncbi:uncharacterized protein EAE97_001556 [Botrytis byssoidea]|uniref:Uncharacterized protein n=1 Tax=Botrytis byssoidea TaxID=139641 RepID=A0A9P5IYI8_9HELO|nr:uncharacterized protein EAE97_001556 [Botrytis byssoidea]KAF7952059.1 hypothetical protein EAE97_001556 [Botrytis byssoidea]
MVHRRVNTNFLLYKMHLVEDSGLKIYFLLLRRFYDTSRLVFTAPRRQYGQSATSNYDTIGFRIY